MAQNREFPLRKWWRAQVAKESLTKAALHIIANTHHSSISLQYSVCDYKGPSKEYYKDQMKNKGFFANYLIDISILKLAYPIEKSDQRFGTIFSHSQLIKFQLWGASKRVGAVTSF